MLSALQYQSVWKIIKRTMRLPTEITVTKNGVQVFKAEAGRLGREDSACRDFICFASPIIGAAYYYLSYHEAARHICDFGYETNIIEDGRVSKIQQDQN